MALSLPATCSATCSLSSVESNRLRGAPTTGTHDWHALAVRGWREQRGPGGVRRGWGGSCVRCQRSHTLGQRIEFAGGALHIRDGRDGRGRKLLDFREQARLLHLQILDDLEQHAATGFGQTVEIRRRRRQSGADLMPDVEEFGSLVGERGRVPHGRHPAIDAAKVIAADALLTKPGYVRDTKAIFAIHHSRDASGR